VPRQDRIRRDDRRDLAQDLATERFSFHGQASALRIGETDTLPARFELFLENPVLFDQVGDDPGLLSACPGREGRK
jgi:hypothetical protein